MLVNLSPKNKFRSMSERHAKHMARAWDEKHCTIKFTDFFEPTEYTGVYWSNCDYGSINAWCKQKAVYNSKGFRDKLRSIPRDDIDTYMDFDSNAWTYGVADNLEQIVEMYNENQESYFEGNHVVLAFKVHKDPQHPCCGWRWHKWGQYIGTQSPKCEYLNDEPEIEEVVVFSIYKVF